MGNMAIAIVATGHITAKIPVNVFLTNAIPIHPEPKSQIPSRQPYLLCCKALQP